MRDRPLISRTRKIFYVGIIISSVFLIYFFGFREMRFFKVPSSSMVPTLLPDDYLLTLGEKHYHRGDVVVLEDPTQAGAYLVKRVVGVPGDTLLVDSGALILNGKYASEPYIAEPIQYSTDTPVTIGQNEVYVLGDNRNISDDSHIWKKAVPMESIVGRVILIYLPFNRMQRIHSYPLTNYDGG